MVTILNSFSFCISNKEDNPGDRVYDGCDNKYFKKREWEKGRNIAKNKTVKTNYCS